MQYYSSEIPRRPSTKDLRPMRLHLDFAAKASAPITTVVAARLLVAKTSLTSLLVVVAV